VLTTTNHEASYTASHDLTPGSATIRISPKVRHFAAYDCQALAALRSTLWSIPSRKRIGKR